jgi:hypothetical protein
MHCVLTICGKLHILTLWSRGTVGKPFPDLLFMA